MSGGHETDAMEHREMELAASVLRQRIEDTATDDLAWGLDLSHALHGFREEFALHQQRSEEQAGRLDVIIAQKPALAHRAEEQTHDHRDILAAIGALDSRLQEQLQFRRIARDELSLEARIALDRYRLHMMRCGDLVYEAYFQEEGGED